ncbi:MAG: serine hydrolase [Chloroflexota bacterium]|jgi:CubicO group peptidase (beta-lactamase class C family)
MNIFRRVAKGLLWLLAGLSGLLVVALFVVSVIYSPEYVYRVLVWQESDYGDYMNNFPQRVLHASPESFIFDSAPDEDRVRQVFEANLGVDDFDAFLEANDAQAFIVIQDDKILYEKYFNGAQRDTLLTSFSAAKSYVTTLVGIAVAEGYINSVDDPITDYLPELAERNARFNNITIRHLMMMASGLDYQEMRWALFNGDDPLTTYYPDQRKAALEYTKIVDPPGEYFQYNKYHPQLLGLILERSTGMSVTDYMQQKLWAPIGAEFDGAWSLDSEGSGFEKMEAGLNARAIDFAKLGRLYLHDGAWNGTQVIPAEWVAEATQVDPALQRAEYYPDDMGQTIFNDLNGYYKYMWYGFFRGRDGYDFAAEGDHGQFIYVSPAKNLIVVRNGLEYGQDWNWANWIKTSYHFASEFDVAGGS